MEKKDFLFLFEAKIYVPVHLDEMFTRKLILLSNLKQWLKKYINSASL